MNNESKAIVTKNFLKHLTKGGIKIIPIFGGLLEEMIFGTLEADSAAKEVEKLWRTIEAVQEKYEEQSVEVSDLITEIREGTSLGAEAESKLDELQSAMFEANLVPANIEIALEKFLRFHERRMVDIVNDLEAVVTQLAYSASSSLEKLPNNTSRIEAINTLANLTNPDLAILITATGAAAYIAEKSSTREQASELVRWAESETGPGIDGVMNTARRVVPGLI